MTIVVGVYYYCYRFLQKKGRDMGRLDLTDICEMDSMSLSAKKGRKEEEKARPKRRDPCIEGTNDDDNQKKKKKKKKRERKRIG